MILRHGIIEAGSKGDLDSLDGIENQKAKVSVEFVKLGELLESCSRKKVVCQFPDRIADPQLEAVSGKAVVTDLLQPLNRERRIRYFQPAAFEDWNQLCRRFARFRVDPVYFMILYKGRRGLVRFRKPESRAAHCRDLYGFDFRLAQVEFFHLSGESGVGIDSFLLILCHLYFWILRKKEGVLCSKHPDFKL
jgi:hypothetical protein